MVAELSQTVNGGDDVVGVLKTKTFTLDPGERLSGTEDRAAGVALRQTVNHDADGGDAPAWITEKTRSDASSAWAEAWTRNVLGPDGDLAIIAPGSGGAKIQISNLHGDVVTQLDNTTGTPVIDVYVESTEYGLAKTPGASLGQHYGWLGDKRRSTDSLGGLTLMGVRLYNPVTGRFASMDPVYGGNDNTYAYPADPINFVDDDGEAWYSKRGGSRVLVTHKILSKIIRHGIRPDVMRYILRKAYWNPSARTDTKTRRAYDWRYRRYVCNIWGKCHPNGQEVTIRMVVEWAGYGRRKGYLVTMFCVMNRGNVCPVWVQTDRVG